MTRIRVLAGPTPDNLKDITSTVNTKQAYAIVSPHFDGKIAVYLKDYIDSDKGTSEYFGREDRKRITWSIQTQGRFLQKHSANDILFGNIFEKELKLKGLGISFSLLVDAVLPFIRKIDPTLKLDVTCSKPWAVSPLIATMPHFAHKRIEPSSGIPTFPSSASITDDTSQLGIKCTSDRKSFFKEEKNRKEVNLGPQDLVTTDFCYGFMQFSPELKLGLPDCPVPGINPGKYLNGQPLKFVCCERKTGSSPVGKVFWCVAFEEV